MNSGGWKRKALKQKAPVNSFPIQQSWKGLVAPFFQASSVFSCLLPLYMKYCHWLSLGRYLGKSKLTHHERDTAKSLICIFLSS